MVVIGLVLIALGALAILCAFAFTDPGTGGMFLGVDVNTLSAFLIGVAAGAAILWGFAILKWGTKRSLAHRRERKELSELNAKLERVEAERRNDDPEHRDNA
jgi:Flp pilus assembly protein TadB